MIEPSIADTAALRGILDHLPVLHAAEHEVVAAVAKGSKTQTLSLPTRAASRMPAVALAAMCDALVAATLDDAPWVPCLCAGTSDLLAGIACLLAKRPVAGQVALTSRWIPRIAHGPSYGNEDADGRKTLGPLPALCLLHGSDGGEADPSGMVLAKSLSEDAQDACDEYALPWYATRASMHYLDCVSHFLHSRVRGLDAARAALVERLRGIEQDRLDLVVAYEGVLRAHELRRQLDGLRRQVEPLRDEFAARRLRLREWEELQRANPPKRTLFGGTRDDQSELIASFATPGEGLAEGKARLEDVCAAYRDEVERIEDEIDYLRAESQDLLARVHEITLAMQSFGDLVRRLAEACALDASQASRLRAALDLDSADASPELLNQVLDLTVRPAEFWLAVHAQEARWLKACSECATAPSGESEEGERPVSTLATWADLCPFQMVTSDAAVPVLQALGATPQNLGLVLLLESHEHGEKLKGLCARVVCLDIARP